MTALPQHMQALADANVKRKAVAGFKNRVRALPARDAAELVADAIECDYQDPFIGCIRTRALLLAIHRMGDMKASKCLTLAGVAHHDKRLRDLTPRQRKAVALQLRIWAAGYRG